MAKCPHCGTTLHIWNIKAECPSCGVNIPNYNWEERLEQDAVRSEEAFARLHKTMSNFKSGLVGGKFRIARLIFTFMPLLMLVVPLMKASVSLPYYSFEAKNISILNIILDITGGVKLDIGSLFSMAKIPEFDGGAMLVLASVCLLGVGFIAAVLNFFFLLFGSFRLKYGGNVVLCALSVLSFTASAVLIIRGFSVLSGTEINAFSASVGIALFLGILLTAVNLAFNIITVKQVKKQKAEEAKIPPESAEKKPELAEKATV